MDDDTSWLDALAGRTDRASSALVLEALALRGFIQSQRFDVAPPVPTVDPVRERELLERAGREGLLPRPAAPLRHAAPPRRWFADTRVTLAATAMVLAAIGVGLWRSTRAHHRETEAESVL